MKRLGREYYQAHATPCNYLENKLLTNDLKDSLPRRDMLSSRSFGSFVICADRIFDGTKTPTAYCPFGLRFTRSSLGRAFSTTKGKRVDRVKGRARREL